ncbi:MAG: hypothetical protein MJK11_13470 [Pseudomonadales bacterium]|uniref:hypothetical protein n=1 Tax=Moritella sp. TaxID=78556 RepID=UPI001DBACD3D|nr:hypothetical protein [Moritella sp.]MCJ8313960.1 hypothetical protein [Pseudomonadales bacterium]NQZ51003.1 hypothetical protein [Moritella sp.]
MFTKIKSISILIILIVISNFSVSENNKISDSQKKEGEALKICFLEWDFMIVAINMKDLGFTLDEVTEIIGKNLKEGPDNSTSAKIKLASSYSIPYIFNQSNDKNLINGINKSIRKGFDNCLSRNEIIKTKFLNEGMIVLEIFSIASDFMKNNKSKQEFLNYNSTNKEIKESIAQLVYDEDTDLKKLLKMMQEFQINIINKYLIEKSK